VTLRLRVLLALLGGLLLGLLVAAAGTSPAAAHAQLLESDPADGSVVQVAPDEVRLTFNESVRLERARLFGADGSELDADARSSDNVVTVEPLEDLGTGTVTVSWELTSADGHVISGAIAFSVGEPTTGGPVGPTADARPEPGAAATVAGLAGALGVLVGLAGLVAGRAPLVRGGWVLAVTGAVLWLPLQAGGGVLDLRAWLDGGLSWRGILVLTGLAGLALAVGPGREGRRVVAGLGAVVTVAALAGAVVVDPAGPEPSEAAAPSGPQELVGDLGDEGRVAATVDRVPGGSTTLTVAVTDTDGQPLEPVEDPAVRLHGSDLDLGPVALTSTGPGTWTGAVAIPTPGEWTLEVSVRVTDFDNPVASLPFTVDD
jgi:copper transport protein